MRLAHILLPNASEYERKCQRADHSALAAKHEVVVVPLEEVGRSGAQVAHVYASGELPAAALVRFPIPYVASAPLRPSRWSFRRPVPPAAVLSPLGDPAVPEAVEDVYFETRVATIARDTKIVGTFLRQTTQKIVDQTRARLARTRTDVTWRLFTRPPSPADLVSVDCWVDPAVSETDFDGFTAEALVVDLTVVAARTAINVQRLEQGRTGLLVPPGDSNEMTHAILSALFKTEVAEGKKNAARQTVSKFRARQRTRVLLPLYESLIS